MAASNVQSDNFAGSFDCHSEQSEALFSIARLLCDESVFRLNAEDKSRFLGPRAARDPRNDISSG